MKIYIGHSRDYDYNKELYEPIRNDEELKNYNIILPHENNSNILYGTDFYASLDLLIAEVSLPSTGLGIELGFAKRDNTSIYCISHSNVKVSSSLKAVTDKFLTYSNSEELISVIKKIIKELENEKNSNNFSTATSNDHRM